MAVVFAHVCVCILQQVLTGWLYHAGTHNDGMPTYLYALAVAKHIRPFLPSVPKGDVANLSINGRCGCCVICVCYTNASCEQAGVDVQLGKVRMMSAVESNWWITLGGVSSSCADMYNSNLMHSDTFEAD